MKVLLKFIFGLPASGKTYTVLDKIKKCAESGKQAVLLVPEQFSFESERAVLKGLGDQLSQSVAVMSFSRLCDEVGRNTGGIAAGTLTDAQKVVFMNRALLSVKESLTLWQRYCGIVSFAKTMLDTVGEFKINSVTADDLRLAAAGLNSEKLKHKLNDAAIIYEAYDMLVGEKYIDPADELTRLYTKLSDYKYFENKAVFIDSFKGFTGQQFKIIDRILAQTDEVTVSLTNDPRLNAEFNVFTNIRAAAEKIRRIAARHAVKEDEPLCLFESRYNSPEISALERLIASDEFERPQKCDGITVCAAATAADEAEFAVRTIRRLVRENGMRYRDFVIISRDSDKYDAAVTAACLQNGVPCFADRRVPLSAFPLAAAVGAAAECAQSTSSEAILRFNKTGLGTLATDEISALENYTTLWGIGGDMWDIEWTMDPRGFVADENKDIDKKTLAKINGLRKKAWEPIKDFKEKFNGTAADMVRAAVELTERCGAADKLAALAERFKNSGNEWSGDVLKQSYDKYMRLLDSLALCFGEKRLKKSEFCEALRLAVSFDSVGVIPRTLDEVTFGSADRIRPSRPKAAFILGANQGVFPKNVTAAGIFSSDERRRLIESGIEIPDGSVAAMIDEDYLVYCNLCCPSDRLYISYALNSLTGENYEPSAFVSEIAENIGCNTVTEPEDGIIGDALPETEESAYSLYCRRRGFSGGRELKAALENSGEREKLAYLENKLSGAPFSITEDAAKELYGTEIKLSASKFDTFKKCRFYYFCKYGIRAKKLQPAEFDVLQRGTVVHYVLEKIVGKYKKAIANMPKAYLDGLVDKYINEYLDSVAGYRAVETERAKFLVSRISRSLKEVVYQLAREFGQSDFEPVSCELKIGEGGELPELIFPYDGGSIRLSGSIDRVDNYNGYVRVIDYKTGSRKFKLPDILFGLNLQMLIYLYAVIRGGGLGDEKAAGILYMPSKRDINEGGMAMNGYIRKETDIVSAMDKDLNGEFVPKLKLNKDGSVSKTCTSFASAEDFSLIFDYIEKLMKGTGKEMVSGDIAAVPLDGRDSPACKYCDYAAVCGRENAPVKRVPDLKNEEVLKLMGEETANGI